MRKMAGDDTLQMIKDFDFPAKKKIGSAFKSKDEQVTIAKREYEGEKLAFIATWPTQERLRRSFFFLFFFRWWDM